MSDLSTDWSSRSRYFVLAAWKDSEFMGYVSDQLKVSERLTMNLRYAWIYPTTHPEGISILSCGRADRTKEACGATRVDIVELLLKPVGSAAEPCKPTVSRSVTV